MEGTSFFSGRKPKGSMLVKSVAKHKNKIVTSDVDITIVLVVKVKIKRAVLRSSRKDGKSKFFKQRVFGLYFLAHLGWKLQFAKMGRWSEMS